LDLPRALEEQETTINLLDEDDMVIDMLCSLEESDDKISDDDVEILDDLKFNSASFILIALSQN
jgi:hypothetical protein